MTRKAKAPRKAKVPMKARGPQRMTDKQLKAAGFKIGLWRLDERKNRNSEMVAAYKAGANQYELAERYGISQPRVHAILTRELERVGDVTRLYTERRT
jgi:DNA-directed RNA polymerase specialized sigma subunit